jgi:hypothetical protein
MPNGHKIFQKVIKYDNILYFKALQIYQNWDFGLKTNHLATLLKTLHRDQCYKI